MPEIVNSGKRPPNSKHVRDLLRQLPEGFTIGYGIIEGDNDRRPARAVGKHPLVFDAEGHVVRTASGMPVTVAGTPSDWRTMQNTLARIRKALR